jgi:hypothetical protein
MDAFKPGEIVSHFKRSMMTEEELAKNPTAYLYEIIGYGKHTETKEDFVVYKTLYNKGEIKAGNIYIRPAWMFESPTDKEKYPDAKQTYRFEKYELYNA